MDFCDKLVISITLVIVTVFCVLNTFCFASSSVPLQYLPNSWVNVDTKKIVSFKGRTLSFVPVLAGSNYTFYNDNQKVIYAFALTSSPEIGSTFKYINNILPNGSFTYEASSDTNFSYLLFYSSNGSTAQPRVVTNKTRFSDIIALLTSSVTPVKIWETFESSVPFASVVVLCSFGFYLIIHNILEISKGRDD